MALVADANVLIDYAKTDRSILTMHVRHFGPIFVPRVILDEVDQLDAAECESLGLTIVETFAKRPTFLFIDFLGELEQGLEGLLDGHPILFTIVYLGEYDPDPGAASHTETGCGIWNGLCAAAPLISGSIV